VNLYPFRRTAGRPVRVVRSALNNRHRRLPPRPRRRERTKTTSRSRPAPSKYMKYRAIQPSVAPPTIFANNCRRSVRSTPLTDRAIAPPPDYLQGDDQPAKFPKRMHGHAATKRRSFVRRKPAPTGRPVQRPTTKPTARPTSSGTSNQRKNLLLQNYRLDAALRLHALSRTGRRSDQTQNPAARHLGHARRRGRLRWR